MKKVLSVLVALLLIAVACVPAFAADTYKVDVESSADTAAVGDVITVSFKVSSGLSGFKGVLEYNTENYKYVAGSAEATDLFTTEINDTVDGKITVASVASEAKDAGVVFTAKFSRRTAFSKLLQQTLLTVQTQLLQLTATSLLSM